MRSAFVISSRTCRSIVGSVRLSPGARATTIDLSVLRILVRDDVPTTNLWLLPISMPLYRLYFGVCCVSMARNSLRDDLISRFSAKSGTYGGIDARRRPFGATLTRIERDFTLRRTVISPNSSSCTVGMLNPYEMNRPRIFVGRGGGVAILFPSSGDGLSLASRFSTARACDAYVCLPLMTRTGSDFVGF